MSSTPFPTYALPLSPSERRLLMVLPAGVAACVLIAVYAPAVLGIACAVIVGAAFFDRPFPLLLVMVFLIPFNFVFSVGSLPVAVELVNLFAWIPFLMSRQTRNIFLSSKYNKWFSVLVGVIVLSLIRSHDVPYTVK